MKTQSGAGSVNEEFQLRIDITENARLRSCLPSHSPLRIYISAALTLYYSREVGVMEKLMRCPARCTTTVTGWPTLRAFNP